MVYEPRKLLSAKLSIIENQEEPLLCREYHCNTLHKFIFNRMRRKNSGAIYLNGRPGSGKTAVVTWTLCKLLKDVHNGEIPDFQMIEINSRKVANCEDIYREMWHEIGEEWCTAEVAKHHLKKHFATGCSPSLATLVVIDELDDLCVKHRDIIYNVFDWAKKTTSRLIAVSMASLDDLPLELQRDGDESRLGITRLVFDAYTSDQLRSIIEQRLSPLPDVFNSEAINMIARRVAANNGDMRMALDTCRAALDKANGHTPVTAECVDSFTSQLINPKVEYMKRCASQSERCMLRAIRDSSIDTGLDEHSLNALYTHFRAIVTLEGGADASVAAAVVACHELCANGLVKMVGSGFDIHTKMVLNVSHQEIEDALKSISAAN